MALSLPGIKEGRLELKQSVFIVSSDNALGSASGDVDDAFAFCHLLANRVELFGLYSIFGNTTSLQSMCNTNAMFEAFGSSVRMLLGAQSSHDRSDIYASKFKSLAASMKVDLLELGPLTNLSNFLFGASESETQKIDSVRIMGTALHTRGRWPPIWPFEYNLTKDRAATRNVFLSKVALLIFPLDVARKFRIRIEELELTDAASSNWLSSRARRWFRRNRTLYFSRTVVAWDVLIAVHVTHPHLFKIETRHASVDSRGVVSYVTDDRRKSSTARAVEVVVDFDVEGVRRVFHESLARLRICIDGNPLLA